MTKITKREMFEQIRSHLTDEAEIAFIDHELELLKRKNERKSDKPTKNQIANAGLMDIIYDFMEDGKRYTVTEIHQNVDALKEFSGNKVSALVRGLKLDGRVIRTEEKGKAYFTKA
jgi:hypothetical protein